MLVPTHAFAADISNVNISTVTATSAVITWSTDTKADSTINFGLDASFGIVRDPSLVTEHSLTIPNLDADTTYHFRISSADQDGNMSATGGFVLTTKLDSTSAVSPALLQKIVEEIKKLKNPEDFAIVDKALKQAAGNALKPPTVLGAAKVVPNETGATVTWTTDRESGSAVYLEPDSTFDPNADKPYSITQGDAQESVTDHSVTIIGLQSETKYHFKVSSEDSDGLVGETADDTFTTKSALPEIKSPTISRIGETNATVSWNTGTVLANGVVDFTDLRTKKTLSMGDPVYVSKHAVELKGLIFGTRYSVVIHSQNKSGDEVTSKPMTFVTVRDTIPPVISKVNNVSTLFPSDNVQVQTIISWETDEPAYCQLFYINGVVRNDNNPPTARALEQNARTDHTEVMVGLTPSAVYKFWVQCHDEAGNPTQSEDYVLITPTKEKSIIDLILQNFQGSFGWVNNIGK